MRGALVDRCDQCGHLLVKMRQDQHAAVEAVYEDLSWQLDHPHVPGLKLEPWQWHQLMLFAFAKEKGWNPVLMPSLDGDGLVMLVRNKQSRLTKRQGSELIEFAKAWATQHGAVEGASAVAPFANGTACQMAAMKAAQQFDRRRGACAGKERFDSFAVAEQVAERRRRGGTKNHPYRCRVCHAFHLGSKGVGGRARRPHQAEEEVEA